MHANECLIRIPSCELHVQRRRYVYRACITFISQTQANQESLNFSDFVLQPLLNLPRHHSIFPHLDCYHCPHYLAPYMP